MINTVSIHSLNNGDFHEKTNRNEQVMLMLSVNAKNLYGRLIGNYSGEVTCRFESESEINISFNGFLTPMEKLLIVEGLQNQVEQIRAAINPLVCAEFEKLVAWLLKRQVLSSTMNIDVFTNQQTLAFELASKIEQGENT